MREPKLLLLDEPFAALDALTRIRMHRLIIELWRKHTPAVLLVTNSDSYRKRRYPVRNAEAVRRTMLRLAEKHGCGVWDLYGVMGGQGSIRRWKRQGLARPDLVHFTRDGYTLIGDLMFTAIMKSYGEHLTSTALTNGR